MWHLREVVSLHRQGGWFFVFHLYTEGLPFSHFRGKELGVIRHLYWYSVIAWSCKLELVAEIQILFNAAHFQGEFPGCQEAKAKTWSVASKIIHLGEFWFTNLKHLVRTPPTKHDFQEDQLRSLCPISCKAKDNNIWCVYIYIYICIHLYFYAHVYL